MVGRKSDHGIRQGGQILYLSVQPSNTDGGHVAHATPRCPAAHHPVRDTHRSGSRSGRCDQHGVRLRRRPVRCPGAERAIPRLTFPMPTGLRARYELRCDPNHEDGRQVHVRGARRVPGGAGSVHGRALLLLRGYAAGWSGEPRHGVGMGVVHPVGAGDGEQHAVQRLAGAGEQHAVQRLAGAGEQYDEQHLAGAGEQHDVQHLDNAEEQCA